MSRYTYKLPEPKDDIVEVAYGYDHATGFFFQGLDAEDEAKIDLDSLFHNLSGADLAAKLEEFDVPVYPYYLTCMMMDLPF